MLHNSKGKCQALDSLSQSSICAGIMYENLIDLNCYNVLKFIRLR